VNHLNPSEAEQGVIGGVFMRPDCYELADLEEEHFSDPRHRLIWRVIGEMRDAGQPIDEQTVLASIEARGYKAVELAYVAELALHINTPAHVEYLAGLVREAALTRAVRDALNAVVADILRGRLHGGEALSAALAAITRLDVRGKGEGASLIGQIVGARFKELEDLADLRKRGLSAMTGLPTSLRLLDDPAPDEHHQFCAERRGGPCNCDPIPGPSTLGGIQIGVINMLLGRPAMGKSALARTIVNACTAAGHGAHVFSMEDGRRATADNAVALFSQVPANRMRTLELNRGEMSKIGEAIPKIQKRRNWIVDHHRGYTPSEIVRCVRRQRKENGTRLVVVDYFNLVRFEAKRGQSRADQMRDGLEEFAVAAGNDDIAWLVLAQLNRDLEKRDDKRPTMADAKDCGAVEEMCKVMMAVYRDVVYTASSPADEMEVLLLKNSGGAPYTAKVKWNGPTMTVSDRMRQ
jgi:replicative DNA helicase